ncbi:calcium-binding protein [Methylorubrum sp. SB2]|uniref:calcium-binding protein n=1 Tax=Methylorubrum subtropicum TaxID=3138812 RepID=UPI00313EE594
MVTSKDGRWTLTVVNTLSYESEWADTPSGHVEIYLLDNISSDKTILYDFTGVDRGWEFKTFFSPDSRFAIYSAKDPNDPNITSAAPALYVIDTITKEITELKPLNSYYRDLRLSDDGSKLLWLGKVPGVGNVTEIFYFPNVPQFSPPIIESEKIGNNGSGTLIVGDSAYITLELKGVARSTDQEKITLTLNSEGTAVYDATKSRPGETYVFKYTVKADQVVRDLRISSINLNGAEVVGSDGKSLMIDSDFFSFRGRIKIDGLTGSSGDENFLGTAGADSFVGGAGNDTYRIDHVADRVRELVGQGYDTVVSTIDYALASGVRVEVLRVARSAWTSNIDLTGNEFDQTLEGNIGNNILDGSGGADSMRGLLGDDTFIVDNRRDQVIEGIGRGHDTVIARTSYKLAAGQEIEVMRADARTANPNIGLTGNEFAQALIGNAGDNVLDGRGGADVMTGGAGNDTYIVDQARDVIRENAGQGYDRIVTSLSYTLGANVEMLTLTGTGAVNATGNGLANHLVGNGAANVLDGKGGADVMEGGRGNDTYVVDQAGDRVVEAKGGGADTVVASASWSLAAGQEVETIRLVSGSAKLNLTGNEFAQTLRGNAGANVLDGKGGADRMEGGAGNDTYLVENARDLVVEARGHGTDTVVTTVSYGLALGQEVEAVRLAGSTGQRNLDLTGNEFGQALTGNDGANVLDGRGGADVLIGGRGPDAFVFSTKLGAGNVDRITDFAPVDDTIRLAEDVFSALAPGPLAASAFKNISTGKVDANDRILYKQASGELFYDADGSGKGAAVKFAVLDNYAKLTHDDFFVV